MCPMYHNGKVNATSFCTKLAGAENRRLCQTGWMRNHLRSLRLRNNLTQEGLARLAGTTHATIQRLETGKRRLDDKWIEVFSRIFQCHPGELFAPMPTEEVLSEDERLAVAYVRRIPPDRRPLWFQVGHSFGESEPVGHPGGNNKQPGPPQRRTKKAR